jgi:hypothetical protein
MKRFVALSTLIVLVGLAGCSGTIGGSKQSTMTEGPWRCTAKDGFGNAWSWTAAHKEMALANAFDMCRYRSSNEGSCTASASDCTLITKVPDKLDSLADFGSAQ